MTSQRGMTLVELLVVVAIMMLLIAVGAPMLRPMLEKQGASQGAQALRVMLLRARNMTIDKGTSFALRLERVQDANVGSTNAAVRLSIVREGGRTASSAGVQDMAVSINNLGVITLYEWKLVLGVWDWVLSTLVPTDPAYPFKDNMQVQFIGSGEAYKYSVSSMRFISIASGAPAFLANFPPLQPTGMSPPTPPPPAMWLTLDTTAGIGPPPQTTALPTSVPPLLMPEGICVDLGFSGMGKSGIQCEKASAPFDILVWFRPDGSVDSIDFGGQSFDSGDGLLHFLIGSWEQVAENLGVLSEDTRSNLEIASNIWVTLDPRSGRVVINEIKVPDPTLPPIDQIREARKFANEIWNEVAAPR